VAQRRLYEVDKNPFAVGPKLSLWLVTLAKDKVFTFLDRAHSSADLVGLTRAEVARSFSKDPLDHFSNNQRKYRSRQVISCRNSRRWIRAQIRMQRQSCSTQRAGMNGRCKVNRRYCGAAFFDSVGEQEREEFNRRILLWCEWRFISKLQCKNPEINPNVSTAVQKPILLSTGILNFQRCLTRTIQDLRQPIVKILHS